MRVPIRSFLDLEIYKNTYKASIDIIRNVLPKLPREERNDLVDQLRRSSKAIPTLLADGYSKKHQKNGFKKYLDDSLAECNETIVSLSHVKDLYAKYVDANLVDTLLDLYVISSKQIFTLRKRWRHFGDRY